MSVKLFFSLNVIGVERVVLIPIAIIYLVVRDTYQLQHLQTGPRLRLWIGGASACCIWIIAGILSRLAGYSPHIHRNSLLGCFCIQRLADLSTVDQVTRRFRKIMLTNRTGRQSLDL